MRLPLTDVFAFSPPLGEETGLTSPPEGTIRVQWPREGHAKEGVIIIIKFIGVCHRLVCQDLEINQSVTGPSQYDSNSVGSLSWLAEACTIYSVVIEDNKTRYNLK